MQETKNLYRIVLGHDKAVAYLTAVSHADALFKYYENGGKHQRCKVQLMDKDMKEDVKIILK